MSYDNLVISIITRKLKNIKIAIAYSHVSFASVNTDRDIFTIIYVCAHVYNHCKNLYMPTFECLKCYIWIFFGEGGGDTLYAYTEITYVHTQNVSPISSFINFSQFGA